MSSGRKSLGGVIDLEESKDGEDSIHFKRRPEGYDSNFREVQIRYVSGTIN